MQFSKLPGASHALMSAFVTEMKDSHHHPPCPVEGVLHRAIQYDSDISTRRSCKLRRWTEIITVNICRQIQCNEDILGMVEAEEANGHGMMLASDAGWCVGGKTCRKLMYFHQNLCESLSINLSFIKYSERPEAKRRICQYERHLSSNSCLLNRRRTASVNIQI